MGPRSRDRGICSLPGGGPATGCELQWGRDHVIAEFWMPDYRVTRDGGASMGPRSRDRGISDTYPAPREAVAASMGPRSRDRGIGRSYALPLLVAEASMGPRSRDRGIAPASRAAAPSRLLQWGRDHVIAEFQSPRPWASAHAQLQWGRDHVIAELDGRRPDRRRSARFNGAAIT